MAASTEAPLVRPACGYIQLHADTAKLESLMPDEEAEDA